MSKNFELLYNISNEKGLFETLDGWEEVAEAESGAKPHAAIAEKNGEEPSPQSFSPGSLPDVFRSINETLGPRGPLNADFDGKPEPLVKDQPEPTGVTLAGRFPISRN